MYLQAYSSQQLWYQLRYIYLGEVVSQSKPIWWHLLSSTSWTIHSATVLKCSPMFWWWGSAQVNGLAWNVVQFLHLRRIGSKYISYHCPRKLLSTKNKASLNTFDAADSCSNLFCNTPATVGFKFVLACCGQRYNVRWGRDLTKKSIFRFCNMLVEHSFNFQIIYRVCLLIIIY